MRPDSLLGGHLLELALGLSVLVHVAAAELLPTANSAEAPAQKLVELVALPKARPAPKPAPEPEPPRPAPAPKPLARRAAAPAREAPAAEPPPAPAELSGTTLTADGPGASFEAPSGDGSSRSAPIEPGPRPIARAAPKPSPARPPPKPAAPAPPRTVKAEDLGRRPEPPALASLLGRSYPEEARRRGLGGQATVRARVDPDGLVRAASIMSESEAGLGFGSACQRTLLGSKWSPPLSRDGNPVASWVRYTCRFRVGL